jgi:serine/threonine-protein kinase HipA
MIRYAAFEDIGKRMLLAWNEGITGLRVKRVYSLQEWNPSSAFEGFSDPLRHSNGMAVIGRSEARLVKGTPRVGDFWTRQF